MQQRSSHLRVLLLFSKTDAFSYCGDLYFTQQLLYPPGRDADSSAVPAAKLHQSVISCGDPGMNPENSLVNASTWARRPFWL